MTNVVDIHSRGPLRHVCSVAELNDAKNAITDLLEVFHEHDRRLILIQLTATEICAGRQAPVAKALLGPTIFELVTAMVETLPENEGLFV